MSDVAPNNNRLHIVMDASEVSSDHRIKPDTVVAVLGRIVQKAMWLFQCLVLIVNEHFEDLRIWQGTSVLE